MKGRQNGGRTVGAVDFSFSRPEGWTVARLTGHWSSTTSNAFDLYECV
jgi:hypothetical protein